MTERRAKVRKIKAVPRLRPDVATHGGPTVYTVKVGKAEAARLQSQFGFRPHARSGGLVTMAATSEALALYRAAR